MSARRVSTALRATRVGVSSQESKGVVELTEDRWSALAPGDPLERMISPLRSFFDKLSSLQEAFTLELVLFSSGGPPFCDINFSYVFAARLYCVLG